MKEGTLFDLAKSIIGDIETQYRVKVALVEFDDVNDGIRLTFQAPKKKKCGLDLI